METLLKQNQEIKIQLEKCQELLDNNIAGHSKKISDNIITKISNINQKLLDISQKLTKLNIKIKQEHEILLDKDDIEYLQQEKKSNEYISKLLPALTLMTISDKSIF
jgi:hypothetical protein